MADTKISALTDGTTAAETDRLPVARSPFGLGDNRYVTPAYIKDYILGLANTWTSTQTFANVVIGSSNSLAWSTDLFLVRSAANTLALRNGTSAQTLLINNTFTDGSNYERGFARWSSSIFMIGTEVAGTGTTRDMAFWVGGTSRATIDTSGRFLVQQTASTLVAGSQASLIQGSDSSSTARMLSLLKYRNSSFGPILVLGKSRGGSIGTNTVLSSGDDLGTISFQGVDNANFNVGATITARADGAPSSGSMPGLLEFQTTPSASTTPVARWQINSSGHFLAGADNTYDIGATGATRPRRVFLAEYQEMSEMTAPAAPSTNSVRIYAQDNGGGKTQLMARFATGAAQQIAIEP